MLQPTAVPVNILYPQQKSTAQTLGGIEAVQRRKTISQMQTPGGTRGKSQDRGL
jgi:hypothetical protein|tara:strand:+ start:253 stop:414 length:162 start_codon:yes stop_codon:yes gene_type:complete